MTRGAENSTLAASHRWCRAQARRQARSFYFASIALPPEKKRAAYAIYAFCRHVDDLVDRAAGPAGIDVALAQVSETFDQLTTGAPGLAPFAPAFAWAVRKYQVEKSLFLDLIRGVGLDLGPVRMADWPRLRHYCYYVASVVGLMMTRIFELRDPAGRERAIDLGIAMQLTNILRDVGEDFRLDRVYLPADELAAHGVALPDLAEEKVGDNLRHLFAAQIVRAREHYSRAEAGIPLLADDGSQLTVWLMRHVYAGILDEIERADYAVLHRRVKTSGWRKLRLACRAWRDYRRTRPAPGSSR